jgi:hypothetical protein
MASPPKTRFRLLHQFGDFYAEIFRLKQLARAGAVTAEVRLPTGDGTERGGPDGGNGNAIRASVAALLDRKVAEDKRIDDPTTAEVQRELLYIMIAVADEIFAHLEWPGRPYWQANLFEQQLFHSNVAGERIFRSIETILVRQDEAAKELAAVYLAALVPLGSEASIGKKTIPGPSNRTGGSSSRHCNDGVGSYTPNPFHLFSALSQLNGKLRKYSPTRNAGLCCLKGFLRSNLARTPGTKHPRVLAGIWSRSSPAAL